MLVHASVGRSGAARRWRSWPDLWRLDLRPPCAQRNAGSRRFKPLAGSCARARPRKQSWRAYTGQSGPSNVWQHHEARNTPQGALMSSDRPHAKPMALTSRGPVRPHNARRHHRELPPRAARPGTPAPGAPMANPGALHRHVRRTTRARHGGTGPPTPRLPPRGGAARLGFSCEHASERARQRKTGEQIPIAGRPEHACHGNFCRGLAGGARLRCGLRCQPHY